MERSVHDGAPMQLRMSLGRVFAVFFALGSATAHGTADAQTVDDVARRGACSTSGLEGISAQLAEAQRCLRPGAFVRFAPHPGVTLSSSRVHPYLQASARDALHAAAARGSLRINSAFRTLADQYVLYHSGGCGLAARPGQSNHQTGRAVDVGNYSAMRSALEAAGCTWLGSRDPVHFDCPGTDRRSDAVLAFQRLWNVNHPEDRIAEDGAYGPITESRLARTPAAGFARDGCGGEPGCDGDVVVNAECERAACEGGLVCTEEGGARCVDPACPATGTEASCTGEGVRRVCEDGIAREESCPDGCAEGVCVDASDPCAGVTGPRCLDGGTLGVCGEDGLDVTMTCAAGCVGAPGGAACASGGEVVDAGSGADGGVPAGDAALGEGVDGGASGFAPTSVHGGCSAGGAPGGAGLAGMVVLLGLVRRRRG